MRATQADDVCDRKNLELPQFEVQVDHIQEEDVILCTVPEAHEEKSLALKIMIGLILLSGIQATCIDWLWSSNL